MALEFIGFGEVFSEFAIPDEIAKDAMKIGATTRSVSSPATQDTVTLNFVYEWVRKELLHRQAFLPPDSHDQFFSSQEKIKNLDKLYEKLLRVIKRHTPYMHRRFALTTE